MLYHRSNLIIIWLFSNIPLQQATSIKEGADYDYKQLPVFRIFMSHADIFSNFGKLKT